MSSFKVSGIICVIISLIVLILCVPSSSKSISNEIRTRNNELQLIPEWGYESSSFLTKLITHIFEAFNLKQVLQDIKASKTTDATCHSCKFGIALLQHLLQFGKSKDEVAKMAYTICTTLHAEKPRVCKGIVESFKEEFITVITELLISPSEICGIILGDSCAHVYNPLYNWTLPLSPIPKPPVTPPGPSPSPKKPLLRMLQLSDTHIDLSYAEGGNAVCGEPLCCRIPEKSSVPANHQSGYWGDYRDCDIPMRTLEGMLSHIRNHHCDLDFVIWTGDIPAHDIWNQTRAGQISLIRSVSSLMSKYLSHVPILPALGNHESSPVNSFPRPEVKGANSIDWLYSELEDIWSEWLPQNTRSSIKRGAYYSIEMKPGLKLISLNMNYCNNQNWWLLLNTTDPADELSWLINELQASELLKEKVFIIGHIPPGSNDCLQIWSQNYYRIVNRYESTISAQFFGHTHQDEFQLFYEEAVSPEESVNGTKTRIADVPTPFESFRPTSVAYVSPSATTFGGVNPGYRIYTIHPETFEILDHETYFMNLTEANAAGPNVPLKFDLSYRAKDYYAFSSMAPVEWHLLILQMVNDEELFKRFEKLIYNQSKHYEPCLDQVCKADILCRLISGKSHDYSMCHKFLKDLNLLSSTIESMDNLLTPL